MTPVFPHGKISRLNVPVLPGRCLDALGMKFLLKSPKSIGEQNDIKVTWKKCARITKNTLKNNHVK